MPELDYPSGPWTGFFDYGKGTQQFPMDLFLNFSGRRITGDGRDPVGGFVISGEYDVGGNCQWTKTYPTSHDVYYRGFRDGNGIWGTWELRHWATGGFHIWPLDAGGAEIEAEESLEMPVETMTPSLMTSRA